MWFESLGMFVLGFAACLLALMAVNGVEVLSPRPVKLIRWLDVQMALPIAVFCATLPFESRLVPPSMGSEGRWLIRSLTFGVPLFGFQVFFGALRRRRGREMSPAPPEESGHA